MRRMKKYKIGYTTGVYDLFHIGHLNVIRSAKKLCEYLIVGVSTDELVMTLKGREPVIPFNERIEIISALKYVDEAVPETVQDKILAWDRFKYDVLFKGSDWKEKEGFIELEQQLKLRGAETVFFPYTEHTSSSILSEALKKLS